MEEGFIPKEWSDFKDAFRDMYIWVKNALKKGLSYQVLETSIWLSCNKHNVPIYFYEARDLAYDLGIMEEIQNEVLTKTQK